jgi:hypothetical protein
MSKSPLQLAIQRGLQPTGDLFEELDQLSDYPIRSRADARAVCQALESFPWFHCSSRLSFVSPIAALVGLFQEVDSFECPAFEVFCEEGVPQLVRVYDLMRRDPETPEPSDLLFILKVLSLYGSPAATDRIVQAARESFRTEDYLWHVVLSVYAEGHPERERLFAELQDPLPAGFMAIAFLDLANTVASEEGLESHPFDSPAGKRLLQTWLSSSDASEFSFAHSATLALSYIGGHERDQLLALAMDHPDSAVQLEAVRVTARLGSPSGLKMLGRSCLDLSRSVKARQYLAELGRADLIPEQAWDPEFQALAEFAHWLSHPNELGCPPDEMEVVDHRRLRWPIDGEEKPFWIIRYRLRDETELGEDDVDYGVVGSVTTCHYNFDLRQRSPEDIYAIHCYWEAECAGLIQELEPEVPDEYAAMWQQWPACPVEHGEIVRIVELAPQLKYPRRLIALAYLDRDGEAGWVVLDGPRSQWYSRSELCGEGESEECGVLHIHVGRHLLGLTPAPNWRPPPVAEESRRSPEQIVRAYEALLRECQRADSPRRRELLTEVQSPLGEYFPAYVEAKAQLTGHSESDCLVQAYRLLLRWARDGDKQWTRVALDSFSPLGANFRLYVHALVSRGEKSALREMIDLLAPFWDHSLGYCQLGSAAYYGQLWDLAERYFSCLLRSREEWYKGGEMSLLAEVWFRQGRVAEARRLLVDCLVALVRDMETASRSERQSLEEWFQVHFATLVRLFPKEAEGFSSRHGIPLPPRRRA